MGICRRPCCLGTGSNTPGCLRIWARTQRRTVSVVDTQMNSRQNNGSIPSTDNNLSTRLFHTFPHFLTPWPNSAGACLHWSHTPFSHHRAPRPTTPQSLRLALTRLPPQRSTSIAARKKSPHGLLPCLQQHRDNNASQHGNSTL